MHPGFALAVHSLTLFPRVLFFSIRGRHCRGHCSVCECHHWYHELQGLVYFRVKPVNGKPNTWRNGTVASQDIRRLRREGGTRGR
jgi:hypothetical protein